MGIKRSLEDYLYPAGVSYVAAELANKFGYSTTSTATETNRRMQPQTFEIGELSRRKVTSGRYKRRNLRNAFRLARIGYDVSYYRFSGTNQYCTTAAGFFKFVNHQNKAVSPADAKYQYPMHIYNLSGQGVHYAGFWPNLITTQPASGTGVSKIKMLSLNGTSPTGTSSPFFHHESFRASTDSAHGLEKWASINLLCYGTKQVPVKWEIMIVQFRDDEFSPGYVFNVANSESGDAHVIRFYEWLAQPFIRSTADIAGANEDFRKKVRVLKRISFIQQCSTTIEGSAAIPHMKDIKMFHKQDKVVKFKYDPSTFQTALQEGGNTFEVDNQNDINSFPPYKNRTYLIIRAQAAFSTSTSDGAWNINTCPSYDLTIRKCMMNNSA